MLYVHVSAIDDMKIRIIRLGFRNIGRIVPERHFFLVMKTSFSFFFGYQDDIS